MIRIFRSYITVSVNREQEHERVDYLIDSALGTSVSMLGMQSEFNLLLRTLCWIVSVSRFMRSARTGTEGTR